MKIKIKFLIIIALILVFFILLSKQLALSPNSETIACGGKQGQGGQGPGPAVPTIPGPIVEPPYNNCLADGLAKLNTEAFSNVDEGQLRYDITVCLQDKGYDPVRFGIPLSGVNDALECKKKAMETNNIKESLGTGKGEGPSPPIKIGSESPFKDNCPKVGSKILYFAGGRPPNPGHATVCTVLYCNPKNGHALLDCQDSTYVPPGGPQPQYQIDVGPSGNQVVNPLPSSLNGGNSLGWVQITSSNK